MPFAFDFAVRTVAAWLAAMILLPAALLLLVVLLGVKGSGEAVPVITLLELGTAPFFIVAFFVALALPTFIARHPLVWALGLGMAPALSMMALNPLAGPISFLVTLPTAILFAGSLRLWPPRPSADFA